MAPQAVRVRFAPSPTGHLHVGNARTALFNHLFARHAQGAFILRIEDTDTQRSTVQSEELIYEDLRWLGIDWDEGPVRGGPFGPYRQSERAAAYAEAAGRLLDSGTAYRCFCSVQQIEAERESQRSAGLPPRYSGRCRLLDPAESARRAAQEPHVLRFAVSAEQVAFTDLIRGRVEFPGSQLGDPVIVRADGMPTYNFAVVVDDLEMRITHVIRGEDHLSNTPRQVLMYEAMGRRPPQFAHVSMVLGPDGQPLAKRHGASSVADFRERGFLPQALVNYLLLLGWAHPGGREILSLQEAARDFTLERVGHAASMFDVRKLTWLNAHYLRSMTPEALSGECRSRLVDAGYLPVLETDSILEDWVGRALHLHAGQMETLADAPAATAGLFRFEEHLTGDPRAASALAGIAGEPSALAVMTRFAEQIDARVPPSLTTLKVWRETAVEVGRALGVRGRALYHAIRVAVTAADEGPELDRLVPLIEEGSGLDLPSPVLSCARRARLVAARLAMMS